MMNPYVVYFVLAGWDQRVPKSKAHWCQTQILIHPVVLDSPKNIFPKPFGAYLLYILHKTSPVIYQPQLSQTLELQETPDCYYPLEPPDPEIPH